MMNLQTTLLVTALLVSLTSARSAVCDEPVSIEQVKKALTAAIEKTGHRVGDITNSVIDREAPALARTINDMKDVKVIVNKKYGKEDGLCYAVYPTGEIQRIGYYANGSRIGNWRFYHPDGSTMAKVQYSEFGDKIGQHLTYHPNGNLRTSESYVDGVVHGPKLTFYENGVLQMHQDWRLGKIHGLSMLYYPNGLLKKLGTWTDNKQHGVITSYNEDGSLKEQQAFSDGVRVD